MTSRPQAQVLAAGRVIAPRGDLIPGVVRIAGDRIVEVRRGVARSADLVASEGILAPGLIDLQVNGAAGVDFLSVGDGTDLEGVRRYLLSTGVTAFLPTLISAPLHRLRAALTWWRRAASAVEAPRILGVHVEGPFLNPEFRGAHDPRHLRPPDDRLAALLDDVPGLVRMATLAPELPQAGRVIEALRERGCVVSAGHTAATYQQALAAFARGIRVVTHLFNGMRGLHHREPGIAVAALLHPGITVGLIADLVHVHPAVIRLTVRLKGWRRVALVTDAMAAAGLRRRTARLGGARVRITDAPRLADGTLAGSVLSLDQAVRNLVSLGVPVRQAVLMASAVPARVLGRPDLGRIVPGARADLVLFDRALRVAAVFVGGRRVYGD